MKYRTILIDPPWDIGWNRKEDGLGYETMPMDRLLAMPIVNLADTDCQIWLWTINTRLHEAFHLIEEWGFVYRWTVVWDKERVGLGAWLRNQVEYLLLATRGNPRGKLGNQGAHGFCPSDIIHEKRGIHSRKPKAAYALIERLGEPPRLEIFARDRREGWDWQGNQLSNTIQAVLDA